MRLLAVFLCLASGLYAQEVRANRIYMPEQTDPGRPAPGYSTCWNDTASHAYQCRNGTTGAIAVLGGGIVVTPTLPTAATATIAQIYNWTGATAINVCPAGGASGSGGSAKALCITFDSANWQSVIVTDANSNVSMSSVVLGPFTIGSGPHQLPAAASGNNGWITVVTDGTSGSDCSAGSGTSASLCRSNGSSWVPLGGSGGSGGTPAVSCSVSSASSVTCTHNLGTPTPWVSCYDASGNMIGSTGASTSITSIVATSSNVATITFSGATTGVCAISSGAMGPAGTNGTNGTNGAGYTATSSTSLTVATGSTSLTTQAGLAYSVGACLMLVSAGTPSAYMIGPITAYNSGVGTLTFTPANASAGTCSGIGGSGSHTDWNLSVAGVAGSQGAPGTGNVSTTTDNTYASGHKNDFSASTTIPMQVGTTASLPATCTVGQQYFANDATAGQNLYGCTATNTWTQQSGGGGGSGLGVLYNISSTKLTGTGGGTSGYAIPGLGYSTDIASISNDSSTNVMVTSACTLKNLRVMINGASAVSSSTSMVFTLWTCNNTGCYNQHAASSLSCTIGAGAYSCSDLSDTVSMAAGTYWTLKVTSTDTVQHFFTAGLQCN